MSDGRLISMLAAIDALEKEKPTPFVDKDGNVDPFGAGRQNQWYRDGIAIMNLPSAQTERKKGKWIDTGSGEECSECHEIQYGYDSFRRYCSNCGAEMEANDG